MKLSERIKRQAATESRRADAAHPLQRLNHAIIEVNAAIHEANLAIIHLDDKEKPKIVKTMIEMLELEVRDYQHAISELKKVK
jgi:ribosomal protein L24